MKRCSKCNIEKDDSCFNKRRGKTGNVLLRSHCTDCRKVEKRDWKAKTKFSAENVINKIKENKLYGFSQSPVIIKVVEDLTDWLTDPTWKQRLYHIKNDTKMIPTCICCDNNAMFMDYKKEYSDYCGIECQKVHSQEKRNEHDRTRSQKYNKKYPHIYAWRNVLRNFIVRSNINKTDRTNKMLGYSALEFRNHINELLQPGMTWDNYGDWHVDHKKAVTRFHPDTPAHIVNALSNLQPLWASDNISKGNK